MKETLREFARFLRRPVLMTPAGLAAPGNARAWGVMFVLQVVGLALMLPLLEMWQKAFGLPDPVAFGEVPAQWLPWIVVAIAPPIEELLFRGWQSGRPRALWLLGCALVGLAALLLGEASGRPLTSALVLLAMLIAAPAGWFVLRRRPAAGWFGTGFPAIFYAAAACFATTHLFNYGAPSLLLVPMVLPQAWAALTLGFVRQRVGLAGAILAHVGANGLTLLAALNS